MYLFLIWVDNFYPRSPCGERPQKGRASVSQRKFLSTLSLRRATHCNKIVMGWIFDFYPRSPCGERPTLPEVEKTTVHFYPRSPCGERLDTSVCKFRKAGISIHALLAESDRQTQNWTCPQWEFLSTLSLRRATLAFPTPTRAKKFLSTLSLRRATAGKDPQDLIAKISIHALLAESDCQWRRSVKLFRQFLSTLSLRRATANNHRRRQEQHISIHALLAESDVVHTVKLADPVLFLSTLSLRRATNKLNFTRKVKPNFYPRSPCGERLPGNAEVVSHM